MRLTRRLGFVRALGAIWLSAAACSDDETVTTADGGAKDSGPSMNATGGAKGAGGSSGGAAGRGGAGGRSQSGGTAGTGAQQAGGGSANGGAGTGGVGTGGAGTGGVGAGGTPGTGGGSSGGASTGGADASTEGGPTDAGSEAGTAGPKSCGYRCDTDADCLMGTDAAPDATYKCNPASKRCENPIEMCTTNDDCIPFSSFWFPSCTSDLDCFFPGDVCVDAGGVGLCATPAPTDGGSCSFPPARVTRKHFGTDAAMVDVCGDTTARCDHNRCFIGCDSSTCTAQAGTGLSCNGTSGLCECASSTECTVGACSGQSHHCECVANGDCTVQGQDVCVAGTCGCSSAAACQPSLFRNAAPVCD